MIALAPRAARIPHRAFMLAVHRTHREGGSVADLAMRTGLSIRHCSNRVGKLRRRGVRMPTLVYRESVVDVCAQTFKTLCDVMLDQIGVIHAKPPRRIFADTIADYGETYHRRLWRALARLVADGLVERHGDGGDSTSVTYTRVARRRRAA